MSKDLSTKIPNVDIDWAFKQSDHASVKLEMNLNVDIKMGLTRINSNVLEDPQTLGKVKRELAELLSQIPDNWDAQRRLEYMKMAIRTVISENVGRNRKEQINDITDLEFTLNEMCSLCPG